METIATKTYASLRTAVEDSDADYVLLSTSALIDKRTFLRDIEGNDVTGKFAVHPAVYTRTGLSGFRSAAYLRIESDSFPEQNEGRTHPVGMLTAEAAHALDFV